MSEQAQIILQTLLKAVETDQIKLPTLPEVALKIRQAVEKDCQSANDLVNLLEQDMALSARLLQLANSPLYRSRAEINNLKMAITRLGIRIVKDLVVMLAIKQAFNTRNKAIENQFKEIWQASIEVAAVCRELAKAQTELDAEHALLAGLIYNIGSLPIIEFANNQPALFNEINNIKQVSTEIQSELGRKILTFWNFPTSLIDVAGGWNAFNREHEGNADYVDIIQAGILFTQHTPENTPDDWSTIPAINKLGLNPENHILNEEIQAQLENTRSSLMQI